MKNVRNSVGIRVRRSQSQLHLRTHFVGGYRQSGRERYRSPTQLVGRNTSVVRIDSTSLCRCRDRRSILKRKSRPAGSAANPEVASIAVRDKLLTSTPCVAGCSRRRDVLSDLLVLGGHPVTYSFTPRPFRRRYRPAAPSMFRDVPDPSQQLLCGLGLRLRYRQIAAQNDGGMSPGGHAGVLNTRRSRSAPRNGPPGREESRRVGE